MGIRIGDIEVVKEIVDLHYQLLRTQLILEAIVQKAPQLTGLLTEQFLKEIDQKAVETLQKKFPNMGISKTKP